MVMGRLRNLINRIAPSTVGKTLARLGVKPDEITYLGLALAALAPLAAALNYGWLVPVLIAASSIMDILDGAVARALNRTSSFGSYLDSLSDRLSDALFITALIILGANVYASVAALTFSFLVSYSRSKGEQLGVKMEGVGLTERGERSVLLFVASLAGVLGWRLVLNVVVLLVAVLAAVTVVQRSLHIWKALTG